ncbi:MAG TPA: hypothetical protein CFH84_02335 [Sulfurimonas sp. UBA12504]|nr:MAG: hypothetical protein A2019_03925 [Sulfurimonas sp. GWF2_37_8]DAB30760.1 MAG TPA: hypothetical protein CFH84_02335 [Sulfurimonas sp. UBA12504]
MNLEILIPNLVYIVLVLVAAFGYMVYHVLSKDAQHERNIRSVATVVEELNREIFYLKKELTEIEKNLHTEVPRMSDEEIYQEIERSVYDMVRPFSANMQELHQNMLRIDEQIESRITSLESGVKQISMPSYVHANDDAKIISLFQQGIGLDVISKELNLSKPEVEFVLKINKIK